MQVDGHGTNLGQFDFKPVDWIRFELRKHKRAALTKLLEPREFP
jgi:hypothetical protein